MKEHEQNYAAHDIELEAVVHALKMWCQYLLGHKFILLTDNTYVKNLFIEHGLNARKAIWMVILSELNFDVRHIKGKENRVDDALNRRTHEVYEATIANQKVIY